MKNMHVQGPQIHQFNNISPMKIPRSTFNRSYPRRMTLEADYLNVIFADEILPGDDVNIKLDALVRMATPIKPLMDNLYFETFWFFVPNRLVWSNWEKFQGEQINPGDSVDYTIPVLNHALAPMSTTGFAVDSIYDQFNLVPLVTDLRGISALFNRAYDTIFNDWFRDENIQNSIVVPTGDGPDDPGIYTLRKRNKRKDYFTSLLPWPQKGDPVTFTLGTTAPLIQNPDGIVVPIGTLSNGVAPTISTSGAGTNITNQPIGAQNTTNSLFGAGAGVTSGPKNIFFGNETGMVVDKTGLFDQVVVDLAEGNAISINDLRQAAIYQQILELDARGGTRYVESIFSRFGVISPDFRLQRPELIGVSSSKINVYAVPQTAPTSDDTTPQGNLAAYGTLGISKSHGCRYAATEHGMIIGIANIRADLTYGQGIPRMFLRSTRLDFYEPLQNGLGEQAVPIKEIYAQGGTTVDLTTLGYQERWAEMRFRNAELIGKMRAQVPDSIARPWNLTQEFGGAPALNSSFIESNTPVDEVIAVPSEPQFFMDSYFNYYHTRPMPVRSNPGINRL